MTLSSSNDSKSEVLVDTTKMIKTQVPNATVNGKINNKLALHSLTSMHAVKLLIAIMILNCVHQIIAADTDSVVKIHGHGSFQWETNLYGKYKCTYTVHA